MVDLTMTEIAAPSMAAALVPSVVGTGRAAFAGAADRIVTGRTAVAADAQARPVVTPTLIGPPL